MGLPGPGLGNGALGLLQIGIYGAAFVLAALYVLRTAGMSLRTDSDRITDINTFLIRAAFWAVLLVGLADMAISFMRVEGLLGAIFGSDMDTRLGLAEYRGLRVHLPLIGLAIVLAAFTRTLGFHWLALMIVIAELLIVILRFVFSYEQAFMSDLVRFWYAALFLFASAYTLIEEGHVRVDIFYAGFTDRNKGLVNAVGSLLLGILLCWTILIVGMGQSTSIINSPVLNFEVTQSGFGMYVKYLMAAFLGVFAISMMIQFVSYMFAAVADYRGEPGKREVAGAGAH
jgi:TRAP-type mannitol/chloroaromatic compound transport system permease small subunit